MGPALTGPLSAASGLSARRRRGGRLGRGVGASAAATGPSSGASRYGFGSPPISEPWASRVRGRRPRRVGRFGSFMLYCVGRGGSADADPRVRRLRAGSCKHTRSGIDRTRRLVARSRASMMRELDGCWSGRRAPRGCASRSQLGTMPSCPMARRSGAVVSGPVGVRRAAALAVDDRNRLAGTCKGRRERCTMIRRNRPECCRVSGFAQDAREHRSDDRRRCDVTMASRHTFRRDYISPA